MESNWVGLAARRCQSPRSWLFPGLPRGSEKALLEGGHVPRARRWGEGVCALRDEETASPWPVYSDNSTRAPADCSGGFVGSWERVPRTHISVSRSQIPLKEQSSNWISAEADKMVASAVLSIRQGPLGLPPEGLTVGSQEPTRLSGEGWRRGGMTARPKLLSILTHFGFWK